MTLYKWVREYVDRYSFVNRTKFTGAYFYIYYNNLEGKEVFKRIAYRASNKHLDSIILKIRKEINYDEIILEDRKRIKEQAAEIVAPFAFTDGSDKNG